jgi:hypothetical protein
MNKNMFNLITFLALAAMLLAACAPKATPTTPPTTAAPEMTEPPPAETAAAMPTIDCMGAASGDQLSVMYQWSGIVPVLVFFAFQRYFVRGLTASSVKG